MPAGAPALAVLSGEESPFTSTRGADRPPGGGLVAQTGRREGRSELCVQDEVPGQRAGRRVRGGGQRWERPRS